MAILKHYLRLIYNAVKNRVFYFKKKRFIHGFFKENGYEKIKPFNLVKWHHDLYLFTANDKNREEVFIKLTNLPRILKNENRAYKKLQNNNYLKNHVIDHKGYIKKEGYKALILKRANGAILSEDWMINHIDQLDALIKIVDEFRSLSLVHRDIKLDNFIYEEGSIKVFDFSFMIDKTEKRKLKEIDLSSGENVVKLVDLGIYYKPEPLKWDDYYSLYVIFDKLLKNNHKSLSDKEKEILIKHKEACKTKIGTNTYSILKGE